jgi:antitoxin ParD1/3/4
VPLDIQLDPAQQAFIDELVKSGRCASAEEAVRQGLDLLRQREAAWRKLEAELQKGLDDLDAGRVIPADEVFDQLIKKYEKMAEEQRG